MTPQCQGGCGKTVTEAGKWCSSCWVSEPDRECLTILEIPGFQFGSDPKPTEPVAESIEENILRQAYRLRFGTSAERADALETLAHLINVVQHSNFTNKT